MPSSISDAFPDRPTLIAPVSTDSRNYETVTENINSFARARNTISIYRDNAHWHARM